MQKRFLPSISLWVSVAVISVALCSWIFTIDRGPTLSTAVLGLYRERWFVLNLMLTYLALFAVIFCLRKMDRRDVIGITFMHGIAALALMGLEVISLLGWVDYRSLLQPSSLKTYGRSQEDLLRWWSAPNQSVSGRVQPNLCRILGVAVEPIAFDFQTDRFGYRNPSDKPDAKIICLGDSMLVAGSVPVEQILTERLEKLLSRTVLNASEPAYAPQESFERFRATGLGFSDRLVLHFIFEGNDLSDSAAWREWRSRALASGWPEGGLIKTLLGMLHSPKSGLAVRRRGVFRDQGKTETEVFFLYDGRGISAHRDEVGSVQGELGRYRKEVSAGGGRYAVVLIPDKLTVLHPYCAWDETSDLRDSALWQSPFPAALNEACQAERIPFLDATTALREPAANGVLPFFAADTHLNEAGHKALASAVANWIQKLP